MYIFISLLNRYTKGSSPDQPAVYAIVLNWPKGGLLKLGAPKLSEGASVTILGHERPLTVRGIILT